MMIGKMKQIKQIVKKFMKIDLKVRYSSKKLADKSWLFGEIRQPDINYIYATNT